MATTTNRGCFYFGYGSNVNLKNWEQWCREKGFAAGLLTPHSVAHLPDFELVFNHWSKKRQSGVLNIRKRPGRLVAGVIFKVDGDGWAALDRKEGCTGGQRSGRYNLLDWTAIDAHGAEIPVTTYWVPPHPTQSFVRPTKSYVDIVREGLNQHKLVEDAETLELAADDQPIPMPVDAFFVYGTLLRDQSRFPMLQRHGLECTLLATTFGRLLDLGSFPGLVDITIANDFVRGDFIRVREVESALLELDQLEGFRGYDQSGSLYHRILVNVDVGEGRIRRAWTYVLAQSADQAAVISSGDWREHRHERDNFLRRLVAMHAQGNEKRLATALAGMPPFYFSSDIQSVVAELMPLPSALATGAVSERRLAQVSGSWVTVP